MAKGKPKSQGKREKLADFRKLVWVVNNVNGTTLDMIDAQQFDVERTFETLETLVDEGIDVKIGWDTYSGAYQVTFIGAWKGFPNAGFALSARSGIGVVDAMKIALGKLFLICDGDMKSQADTDNEISKRG